MTTEGDELRCTPVADHALLVDVAEPLAGRDDIAEERANRAVVALDRSLADAHIAGVREVLPALVNLLVEFDPVETDHAAVEAGIRSAWRTIAPAGSDPTVHTVPVCYDADLGPDLDAVASARGLSVDAVVAAHLAGEYRVLMYGFAPGCAYLGGVPESIRVPRKPAPVRNVPAGSVIVAESQCLITTLTMPTGWSILGASPARILPTDGDAPILFGHGDDVRFERVDRATFDALGGHP